jgi:hypothetical protein
LINLAPTDVEEAERLVPGAEHITGLAKLPDDLMLIYDVRTLLSRAEAASLDGDLPGAPRSPEEARSS